MKASHVVLVNEDMVVGQSHPLTETLEGLGFIVIEVLTQDQADAVADTGKPGETYFIADVKDRALTPPQKV